MANDMTDVATEFVTLALKYPQWQEITTLPEDEVLILFNLLQEAGFNPQRVTSGRLIGHCRDQDGSRTGATYPINELCGFKVESKVGYDDSFATGWLDCALQRVVFGMHRQNESPQQLVQVITQEIKRSLPLTPILLTPQGDLLVESARRPLEFGLGYFVEHARDTDWLNSCLGVHAFCSGYMDRVRTSATHDVAVCKYCHLRVPFPKEVKTYDELRQALAPKE